MNLDDDEVGLIRATLARRFEKWWAQEDRGFGHKDVAFDAFAKGLSIGLRKDIARTRNLCNKLVEDATMILDKAMDKQQAIMDKQQAKLDKARMTIRKMRRKK